MPLKQGLILSVSVKELLRRVGERVTGRLGRFRRLGVPRGWVASEDWEREYQGDGEASEDWERE